MKKFFLLFLLVAFVSGVDAQQDMTFSMYNFTPLFSNPATAGYQDKQWLSAIFRYQWVGLEGAPLSGNFAYQTPLKNNNMAIGALIKYDKIGLMNNVGIDLNYAYRIKLNKETRLSLGLRGSLFMVNDDRTSGVSGSTGPDVTKYTNTAFLPNFGAGFYLFSKKFFVGASAPHLLNLKISNGNGLDTASIFAKMYNHYFATAGYVFGKEKGFKFKPTMMFKVSQNSTPNIDLSANFLIQERFWLGAAYRIGGDVITEKGKFSEFTGMRGESVIAMFKMLVTERLEIGYSFDYPLSRINSVTTGSHEIYLGYDLGKMKSERFISPRYVNYF